jgi:hypothetical protein
MLGHERRLLFMAKRNRANANLQDLYDAVQTFMENNAHMLETDVNLEEGRATVWPVVASFEIYNLSAIVGDYLHNLRATLDHLAYQLGCLVHDPPTCKTEFPIYWQPKRFARDGKGKIACLAGVDQGLIEGHQPYDALNGTPGDPKSHPLWLLQSMDIEDKHKLINVVAVAATFRRIDPRPHDLEIVGALEMVTGRLEHGDPVASYDIVQTGPNPYMDVKGYGSFSVVFGEGTPVPDEGVFRTLESIGNAVDKVLRSFDARFW